MLLYDFMYLWNIPKMTDMKTWRRGMFARTGQGTRWLCLWERSMGGPFVHRNVLYLITMVVKGTYRWDHIAHSWVLVKLVKCKKGKWSVSTSIYWLWHCIIVRKMLPLQNWVRIIQTFSLYYFLKSCVNIQWFQNKNYDVKAI